MLFFIRVVICSLNLCRRFLRVVFIDQQGKSNAALVCDAPYRRGIVDESGRLLFFDNESEGGAHWRAILTVSFDRANDAFFTAWGVQAACSRYDFDQGRLIYPVMGMVT
jgi:hypothetical protein